MRTRWTIVLVFVLAGRLSGPARAQAPSDASAAAEVLFTDAKALMAQGEFDDACPKFEASLKLDPALGTRVNLGDCYEAIGKVASAWSMFRAAADVARIKKDPREQLALARAAKLEPRLPRLSLAIEGTPPPGMTIVRSGTAVEPAMLGSPIYVDPGRMIITATAPGFRAFEITIEVKEAQQQTVAIPALVPDAAPAPSEGGPGVQPAARPASPIGPDPRRRRLGLAVAGGGLLVAGGGLVVGWMARSAWNDAFDSGNCDRASDRCNPAGQALTDKARSRGLASTVLVGGGIAAIGVGAVLFFTAPRKERASHAWVPLVTPDTLGIAFARDL